MGWGCFQKQHISLLGKVTKMSCFSSINAPLIQQCVVHCIQGHSQTFQNEGAAGGGRFRSLRRGLTGTQNGNSS